jgi:hypothetical protein
MHSTIDRQLHDDGMSEMRQSYEETRRTDWYVFTCFISGRRIVAYSRDNICPVRCDKFDSMLLTALRKR